MLSRYGDPERTNLWREASEFHAFTRDGTNLEGSAGEEEYKTGKKKEQQSVFGVLVPDNKFEV